MESGFGDFSHKFEKRYWDSGLDILTLDSGYRKILKTRPDRNWYRKVVERASSTGPEKWKQHKSLVGSPVIVTEGA